MASARPWQGQLSLPGLERNDLVFFALFPEGSGARSASKIAGDLCQSCGLRARPLAQHRLHVSLHLLGQYDGVPDEIVAKARKAASAIAAAPFRVTFDIAESWRRRKGNAPLVLRSSDPAKPLFALYDALGEAMARNGLACGGPRRSYLPHITLLYDRRDVAPRMVEPVCWTAREFVLVHSRQGRTQYATLARWPLSAPA
jgi:2'-5' RNA ligase